MNDINAYKSSREGHTHLKASLTAGVATAHNTSGSVELCDPLNASFVPFQNDPNVSDNAFLQKQVWLFVPFFRSECVRLESPICVLFN